MSERTRGISSRPKMFTSEDQTRRLMAAGCDFVKVSMVGHQIVLEPVSLAQLWDVVADLPEWVDIPAGIHSFDLVEFLVRTIVSHQSKVKVK